MTPAAALLALSLAFPAGGAPKNPDTLVYVNYVEVDSMDPGWAENMSPLYNVYESLLTFRGAGAMAKDLAPLLSEQVPTQTNGLISPDGRVYRFPIRKGVRFHDGTPLTPEDVRYSLLRAMLLDRAGGTASGLLLPILGVATTRSEGKPVDDIYRRASAAVQVDGDAVVVRLERPYAPFPAIVANLGRVLSKPWAIAQGQWDGGEATWKRFNDLTREAALPMGKGNGTGPFRIERYDADVRQLVLVRHDGYWRGPARLARVHIKVAPEFLTRRLMLEAGDADVIAALPLNAVQLEGTPGVEVRHGLRKLLNATSLTFSRGINPAANPHIGSGRLDGQGIPPDFFDDKDVRAAFGYAIDYDGYVRDVLLGRGTRSAAFIPPGLAGHRESVPRFQFDLKKAEAHFRRAWQGKAWEKGFAVSLVYLAGRPDLQTLAQMIQRNVESLHPGFKITLRPVPSTARVDLARSRKIPFTFSSWTADYPDAHDFAFPLLHSGGYFPRQHGYSVPGADALVEEAASTLDEAKRVALYHRLHDLLDEEIPFIPVAAGTTSRVQRSWVKGFVFNPAIHGLPYDSYYYDLYKAE